MKERIIQVLKVDGIRYSERDGYIALPVGVDLSSTLVKCLGMANVSRIGTSIDMQGNPYLTIHY